MSYAYRLPRKYRYHRKGGKLGNRDAAIIAALVAVAVAASAGHKTVARVAHDVTASRGAAVVADGSQSAFTVAVLADLGAPATQANITSLADWFPHEGTAAENNPMATTLVMPGSTTFNYDSVQNYPSATEGAEATAATLANGRYPLIVAALRSGAGLCGNPSLAGEFLVWSGGGYAGVC